MIIGLGVDIVEIDRMRRMLDNGRERLVARLFTAEEARYAFARAEPAFHLAARVAAKEATFKALAGNDLARTVGWKEIEVCSRHDGAPYLILHGRAQQRAAELGVERTLISLTHSKSAAVGVVVLEK
jgi:holo-[acyl-carrier protein] synthase